MSLLGSLNFHNVYTFEVQSQGGEWYPCQGQWETQEQRDAALLRFVSYCVEAFGEFPNVRPSTVYSFEFVTERA